VQEKAVFNKDAEGRKAVYEQAMAKYKNKDSSKVGYAWQLTNNLHESVEWL